MQGTQGHACVAGNRHVKLAQPSVGFGALDEENKGTHGLKMDTKKQKEKDIHKTNFTRIDPR